MQDSNSRTRVLSMDAPRPDGRYQQLADLVESYQPLDAKSQDDHKAFRQLLATASPFCRAQFTPGHVTVSSLVLSPCERDLLLILHRKLGLWLQPGGHVDPDDRTLLEAARRELLEEAGLSSVVLLCGENRPHIHLDVHKIPARRTEPLHRHYDIRFFFRAESRVITAGSDAAAARWWPRERLSDIETDVSVRRAVATLPSSNINVR